MNGQCPDKIWTIYLQNLHVILPNTKRYTTKLDKTILQSKKEQVVWG